ncbi:Chaperone protein dnaJ 20, chloroplastic [Glycine soja]
MSLKRETPKSKTSSYAVCCLKLLQGVDDNLYKVLSLSPNSATMDDIKKAYKSMALRLPPRCEETTRMFVQLNAAYRTLSNPWLRADYDYELGLRSEKSVEQVAELKRRSNIRMARTKGSWGCRIRAQNMN